MDWPHHACDHPTGRPEQPLGRATRDFGLTPRATEPTVWTRGAEGGTSRHRSDEPMQIAMTIKGLMVDPVTNMPIIILRDEDGGRVLPIWVGVFEANAIALQIENVTTPRPMTHDLLKNVIADLHGRIKKIVV